VLVGGEVGKTPRVPRSVGEGAWARRRRHAERGRGGCQGRARCRAPAAPPPLAPTCW
jgi:hypothetical protein